MSSILHQFNILKLLLLLLLLLPIFTFAQNVRLGSSLTADTNNNASWKSPSGDFAFGFRPLENNLFLLSIWYDKIPDKTVVWYADSKNESTPMGSKAELTTAGKLLLTNPQGKTLWEPESVTGSVTYAAMLDTGNFVLSSGNGNPNSWESFKYPTDTILPTQIMQVSDFLYSRQSEKNYTKGRFRLRVLDKGNFVINPVASPSLTENDYEAYYNLNYLSNSANVEAKQLVFNRSGDLYIVKRNGSRMDLTWNNIVPVPNVYYRATLDFDGVFVQYSHPIGTSNGSQRWSIVRLIPDNICFSIAGRLGSGACGYNSYCVLTSERRPSCECPPRYVFVDPNNRFGGCRPNFMLPGCQEEDSKPDLFELQTIKNVDWPTTDYDQLNSYNEQDCRISCLNDCLCAVAIYREGTCWKKKLPLPNGRLDSAVDGNALIKVRKDGRLPGNPISPTLTPQKEKDRFTLVLVVSLLLGSSVFFNFIFLAVIFLVFLYMDRKLRKKNQKSSVLKSNLRSFTYQELEEATDGFKEELGRGSFGIVYKGVIEEMGAETDVAVKKLDKVIRDGEKEFKAEVSAIGQSHHKNLVRLLGFCEEGLNRLLVYEFMSNGSLAQHLFGISKPDWNQRVQIGFGIARGLMYLHEECSTQIIHCDIKPQNILLDDNFTPRISDFGLAKLLMHEQTRTSTGIRGTRGYVAPEWYRNAPVSVKIDVYSFGVMLLEIICCRKGVDVSLEEGDNRTILTDWAYDCYRKRKVEDLIETDEDATNDMKRFGRLVMIAIWCIQEEPALRPSMKKVTQMLEGVIEVSDPPCPYPYTTFSDNGNEASYESTT